VLFVIRARQAISAEQRLAIDFEADHGELAVFETERGIARASEAEQRVGPVMDAKNGLRIKVAHGFMDSAESGRRSSAFRRPLLLE
jgi:hypothetical protein